MNGSLEVLRLPDAKLVFSCSAIAEGSRLLQSNSVALPAPAAAESSSPASAVQQPAGNAVPQQDLVPFTGWELRLDALCLCIILQAFLAFPQLL